MRRFTQLFDPSEEIPRAGLRLRRMRLEELAAVVDLEKRAFTHPWSAELVRRELENDWATILVCFDRAAGRERLVGFVIFWVIYEELHILNIAVEIEARRRGIASTMLQEVLERAARSGLSLATLEVRRSNQPAIALYERLGFEHVFVRKGYYSDNQEDALVMNRTLKA